MPYLPFVGLFVGTLLRVFVPYVREGLQAVAQSGTWRAWPVFDWRYLALFLIPLLEFGVAFVTIEGLFRTALAWGFVQAVMLAYSGADFGKELVQTVTALGRLPGRGA